MGREQEDLTLAYLKNKFYNPLTTSEEQYDMLKEIFSVSLQESDIFNKEQSEIVYGMLADYFSPQMEENGQIVFDNDTFNNRLNIFYEDFYSSKIEAGKKIMQLKNNLDKENGPNIDENGVDNNLEYAKALFHADTFSADLNVASQMIALLEVDPNASQYVFEHTGMDESAFVQKSVEYGQNLKNNFTAEEAMLFDLTENSPKKTAFILEKGDELSELEANNNKEYIQHLLKNTFAAQMLKGKEINYDNLEDTHSWLAMSHDGDLEFLADNLIRNERAYKDDPNIPVIIDAYNKAFDATTYEEFAQNLMKVQIGCQEYVNNNRDTETNQQKIDIVEQLGNHFDEFLYNRIQPYKDVVKDETLNLLNCKNNKDIKETMNSIKGNTRGLLSNSPEYQAIIDAFDDAQKSVSMKEYDSKIEALQKKCSEYLTSRNPSSPSGKERYSLINQLRQSINEQIVPSLGRVEKTIEDEFEIIDGDKVREEMEAQLDQAIKDEFEIVDGDKVKEEMEAAQKASEDEFEIIDGDKVKQEMEAQQENTEKEYEWPGDLDACVEKFKSDTFLHINSRNYKDLLSAVNDFSTLTKEGDYTARKQSQKELVEAALKISELGEKYVKDKANASTEMGKNRLEGAKGLSQMADFVIRAYGPFVGLQRPNKANEAEKNNAATASAPAKKPEIKGQFEDSEEVVNSKLMSDAQEILNDSQPIDASDLLKPISYNGPDWPVAVDDILDRLKTDTALHINSRDYKDMLAIAEQYKKETDKIIQKYIKEGTQSKPNYFMEGAPDYSYSEPDEHHLHPEENALSLVNYSNNLIETCDKYIASHKNPSSELGKARLEAAKQMREMASLTSELFDNFGEKCSKVQTQLEKMGKTEDLPSLRQYVAAQMPVSDAFMALENNFQAENNRNNPGQDWSPFYNEELYCEALSLKNCPEQLKEAEKQRSKNKMNQKDNAQKERVSEDELKNEEGLKSKDVGKTKSSASKEKSMEKDGPRKG